MSTYNESLRATWELLRRPGSRMTLEEAMKVDSLRITIETYTKFALNPTRRPPDAKQRAAGDVDLFTE